MVRNAISVIILCAVGLAFWRIWGAPGDIDGFFATVWGIFFTIVDAIAGALVTAFNAVFG